jgi:hypothetical protein
MKRKEFIFLSVGWIIDCVLCNFRRQIWVASSTTFVKIVYYCALKYSSSLDVVATFLIKTITHWPPLYASKNYKYFVLKLLLRARTSWSNSHFPFTINNCFSPLLYLPLLTPTMMRTIVIKLWLWRELLNYLMESLWKNIEINSGSKAMIGDTMIVNSIIMITCMSHFTNHLLDLNSMSKNLTFKNILFCKYYSCIFIYMRRFDLENDFG